jgi:peptide/nickel transport system substrate-binding protein
MGIVPAHVLRGTPVSSLWRHPFNLSPIGTGPYQIETLTASGGHIDGIQLRVAPVYRQRPEGAEGYTLDRLVFRVYPTTDAALDAYRRGEVNSIASIPHDQLAAAARLPGLSLYTAIEPHVGVLIYNWKRDAVSFVRNPRARIALAQAVDRTALVMQDLSGRAIPANSPLLPDSWAYDPSVVWPAYNLAQAQAMLDMANLSFGAPPVEATPTEGAPSPEPGTVDEETQPEPEPTDENTGSAGTMHKALTILTPNDPALVALAEGIASGWEQLGFAVAVEPVGAAALHARLEAGDFDAALVELSFEPYADPDSYVFWHQGQYRTSQNYGGMDDRRLSEALEQARREPLGLNRAVYYRRFQELFAERALALTLYYPFYTYAVDARVEGIQLSFMSVPADRFRSIQDWTIGGS